MTVHGAKGLQAPIVFLPDTCMRPRLQGLRLYPIVRAGEPAGEVGHLIWPPKGHSDLSGIEASKALLDSAEIEEYHRLLYVAMTRAEDRLYVCGWHGLQKPKPGVVWYDLIKDGLAGHFTAQVGSTANPQPHGIAWRRELLRKRGKVLAGLPGTFPAWALVSALAAARPAPRLGLALLQSAPPTAPLGRFLLEREWPLCPRATRAPVAAPADSTPRTRTGGTRLGRGAWHWPHARLTGGDRCGSTTIVRDAHSRLCSGREASPRCGRGADRWLDLEGQIDRLIRSTVACLSSTTGTNRPHPDT
jgi:hypothetical protein